MSSSDETPFSDIAKESACAADAQEFLTRESAGRGNISQPEHESRPARRSGEGPVSGAAMIMGSRAFGLAISFVTIAIVARLLSPRDYGLVAMVVSVTAFFTVFSDLGLSWVTVQRPDITKQQLSTLFWVNVAFGVLLGLITVALAPALTWFYGDPRLFMITIALGGVFPLAALGIQHQALLKREMKFCRLASVRLAGTAGGAMVCILAAYAGWGYWALVSQVVSSAFLQTAASFVSLRWLPGRPRRCEDLPNMLAFGGFLTTHGMIGYFANNLDKVLLGRFCGSFALGLYSNSYHLMMRPIALAGYGVGEAAIPAMSRLSQSPGQQKAAYRRMLGLTSLLGLPACLAGVLWADDIVLTLLGDQWIKAIVILRILCLAAIPRMLMASTGWIYVAGGRPDRMLRWQLMWTPFVALAFVAGLPYGAAGVAVGFTLANWIALLPAFAYCFRGTQFTLRDVLSSSLAPLLCAGFVSFVATVVPMVLLPEVTVGPLRLALRLCLAVVAYVSVTAAFVPLANEGLRKMLQRFSVFLGTRRNVARALESPRMDRRD